MNAADLLAATFADHESEAPDVDETRRGIDARLTRHSRRRPLLAATAVAAAVIAIALALTLIRDATDASHPSGRPTQPPAAATHSAHNTPSRPDHSNPPTTSFPFRAGWLPPAATFDHAEIGLGRYHLTDYTFGSVPSNVRGLTLWINDGPLPTRLRDGGTLHHVTIAGRPAVEGWSPNSRSYTVAVLRPHDLVMSVLAYGWDRATVKSYAARTAASIRYGTFPVPTARHH